MPLLTLLDRLDDVQAQRHAGLLDPVDLGRDERLGDPREPHQDVGDGPVHNPVTSRTRPNVTLLRNLLLSLDETAQPVEVFFRDDDAGWEDERLLELIARFAEHGLPLDLAVIPAELHAGARGAAGRHATSGCTSTATRTPTTRSRGASASSARRAATRAAARGHRARARRGCASCSATALDPFFTPPWNRCTRDTGEALVELGFTLLSREHRAEPLGLLPELPVHLDVARLSPDELDERFAGARAARAARSA